jgi:hypothetical protein
MRFRPSVPAWLSVLGAAALLGCQTDRVTTPIGAPAERPSALLSAADAAAAVCAPHDGDRARALIGPEGGVLWIGANELVVPPGALERPVLIRGSTPSGTTSRVDFQPHGLVFAVPATLVLSAAGCAVPDSPLVEYVDASENVAEVIGATYDVGRDAVVASIAHFSGYQIGY